METSTIIATLVAAVITFVVAALAIGRESHRLDGIAPRAVYRLDEAVDFVCDRLPTSSQARLTPAEVERLLIATWDRSTNAASNPNFGSSIDHQTLMRPSSVDDHPDRPCSPWPSTTVLNCSTTSTRSRWVSTHLWPTSSAIGAVGPTAAPDDVIGD